MSTPPSGNFCRSLRTDAQAIWRAAVAAVDSQRLVEQVINCTGDRLSLCGHGFVLTDVDRLCVVGGGKAGAGMSAGFEAALAGSPWADRVSGWVNVPDDCVRIAAGHEATAGLGPMFGLLQLEGVKAEKAA